MAKTYVQRIAEIVAKKHNLSQKDAETFVSAMFAVVHDGLQEDKQVKVKGLGTFKVVAVKSRESVNVNTGERITLEEHEKVSFTPDASMKELVNKPFAQFETVVLNDGVDIEAIDRNHAAEVKQEQAEAPSETEETEAVVEEKADERPAEPEPVAEEKANGQPAEPETVAEEKAEEKPVVPMPVVEENKENALLSEDAAPLSEDVAPQSEDVAPQSEDAALLSEDVAPQSEDVAPTTEHLTPKNEEEAATEVEETSSEPKPVETATEEQKPSEPEPTDTETDEPKPEEQAPTDASAPQEEPEPAEEPHSTHRRLWALAVLGVLIVAAVAGYFWYNHVQNSQPLPPLSELTNTKPKQKTPKKAKPKATPQPAPTAPTATSVDMDAVNRDPHVLAGAYNIVGVDTVVTLKAGQTMESYCRHTLGRDMIVYFQALNGKQQMGEGERMLVPKVMLRKLVQKAAPAKQPQQQGQTEAAPAKQPQQQGQR